MKFREACVSFCPKADREVYLTGFFLVLFFLTFEGFHTSSMFLYFQKKSGREEGQVLILASLSQKEKLMENLSDVPKVKEFPGRNTGCRSHWAGVLEASICSRWPSRPQRPGLEGDRPESRTHFCTHPQPTGMSPGTRGETPPPRHGGPPMTAIMETPGPSSGPACADRWGCLHGMSRLELALGVPLLQGQHLLRFW